ncbi:hypothetical protein [Sediminibacter sp. Hel_I_10]|uniref:hypothetical protein n=1 Tax=Sediminibacter sp. Hel_I_10 TaxID=1392490 RepID=UPI00047BED52|nr:hypothetical protein [Sediminibacter sp. Hel_I_10]
MSTVRQNLMAFGEDLGQRACDLYTGFKFLDADSCLYPSDELENAFDWYSTDEGYDFWNDVFFEQRIIDENKFYKSLENEDPNEY